MLSRAGIVAVEGRSQTPKLLCLVFDEEKRPVRLTAKQAPHRPGISSALGLRAGGDDFLLYCRPELGNTLMKSYRSIYRIILLSAVVTCVISTLACAAPNAGSLVGWGDNFYGSLTVPPGDDF